MRETAADLERLQALLDASAETRPKALAPPAGALVGAQENT
jgi:hypothetical protein